MALTIEAFQRVNAAPCRHFRMRVNADGDILRFEFTTDEIDDEGGTPPLRFIPPFPSLSQDRARDIAAASIFVTRYLRRFNRPVEGHVIA